ncbi:MAG: metal-sensitive transcriptional regulator [Sulfobacillus thermotolerans]|nr:metal-sensitive transcriptional regulator [Sulfobacillus thermotolerans]
MTPEQQLYWDVDDILRRLRRIEGQVRGVQAMIQAQQPCQSVLVQVAAIEGAIKQVSRIVSACSVAEQVMLANQEDNPVEAVKQALQQLIG